jgi:hypothetical protein
VGTTGGVVGVIAIISSLLLIVSRFAMGMRTGRRRGPARWSGQGPGGGWVGYRQAPQQPRQPGPHEDQAYWQADQPDGTLPAEGFIGDAPEADAPSGGDLESGPPTMPLSTVKHVPRERG